MDSKWKLNMEPRTEAEGPTRKGLVDKLVRKKYWDSMKFMSSSLVC